VDAETMYSLWILSRANDSSAFDAFSELFESTDVEVRRRAGYIVSRIKNQRPGMVNVLMNAYAAESQDTIAYWYLNCAILKLNADPENFPLLRDSLESSLFSVSAKQQLEAFRALKDFMSLEDVLLILSERDSLEGDGLVGGAWAVAHFLKREGLHK
jgi:HEAT repeat protein